MSATCHLLVPLVVQQCGTGTQRARTPGVRALLFDAFYSTASYGTGTHRKLLRSGLASCEEYEVRHTRTHSCSHHYCKIFRHTLQVPRYSTNANC